MKTVISTKEIEELLRKGASLDSLPADAIYTPSARDMIRDRKTGTNGASAKVTPAPAPAAPPAAAPADTSVSLVAPSPQASAAEIEKFFNSPEVHALKVQICDIGRRVWERDYVDGNGGNISYRMGDLVLCTPTLISKGFMKPEDMCLVDMDGNQKAGVKKRTSEILMHLQIMKAQPKAKTCVHAHPPHATAFAVAGILPPTCMIPEFEVFCAVAIAPYRTPGLPEMGKLVAELVDKHNTILMANHGVVTWSHNTIEEAYWRMEIVEAYCHTVTVAAQLGKPMQTFSPTHLKDLLNIKQSLGFVDPRIGLKECELCDNSDWRPGVVCQLPADKPKAAETDPEAEKLVQTLTELLMARLKG